MFKSYMTSEKKKKKWYGFQSSFKAQIPSIVCVLDSNLYALIYLRPLNMYVLFYGVLWIIILACKF